MSTVRHVGAKPRLTRSEIDSWKSNLLTIKVSDDADKQAADDVGKILNLKTVGNEIGKFIGTSDAMSVQDLINARANQIRTYASRPIPLPTFDEFLQKHLQRKEARKNKR